MVGKLILRGLLAGLIASIIAFCFAYAFAEPSIDGAIGFEEQQSAAEAASMPPGMDMPAEAEPVPRSVQSTVGLFTGIAVLGVALGGLYSMVFAFANGRIGTLNSAQTAIVVAVLCFLTIYLVPFLKYPASPPAANLGDSIDFRSTMYFLLLAISIVVSVAALLLRSQLVPRFGQWNASVLTATIYVVALLMIFRILPDVREVPKGFPSQVFWDFRLASVGTQALLWASLGVVYGYLVDRTMPQLNSHRTTVPAH
ncbi:MAG: CbtA family protein [Devosia sp.]|nr:CbtA family protein [Devosia sp.]